MKLCDYNRLLVTNNILMKKIAGHASNLNRIRERLHKEMHAKTKTALGLQNILNTTARCFAEEHATCVKRREWHSAIN